MNLTINKLLSTIRKNLFYIITIAILGALLALFVTQFIVPKKYTAQAQMYLDSFNYTEKINISPINEFSQLSYSQTILKSYVQILNSNTFKNKVIEESQLPYTKKQLSTMLNYSIVSDTNLFYISVTSASPYDAQKIANCIVALVPDYIKQYNSSDNIKVVDFAELPEEPENIHIIFNTIVGFTLALIISIIYFTFKKYFSLKIKSSEDLENNYNIPILGSIPNLDKGVKK